MAEEVALNAKITLCRSEGFELRVDLTIPGEGITVLYGPSGSGKTTLLRCLAGLERGGRGDSIEVRLGDEVWQDGNHFVPPHKRAIGYVFQEAELLPHLTARGNLEYARRRSSEPERLPLEQIIEWLELAPLLDHPAMQLSGGERQRVAIGRALVSGRNLILMDEPLGAIDIAARDRILPYLDALHHELSIPVVYVTHLVDELTYLADHVVMLEGGRLVAEGSVMELTRRIDLAISHQEHAASILDCVIEGDDGAFDLSMLTFDGGTLFVSRRSEPPGSAVRVRVPARDVSIALERPSKTSILNIIEARVDAIEHSDESRLLVRLAAGSQYLLARITRRSAATLELTPGMEVFAQIKSVALLSERRDD